MGAPLKANPPPPASSLANRSSVGFQNEGEGEKPAPNCEQQEEMPTPEGLRAPFLHGQLTANSRSLSQRG